GFADLYLNTGTIYDLLSFTFYFLALRMYVGGEELRGWRLAGFLALYGCALNSKEAAATLPLVLMGDELIIRRGGRIRWRPSALAVACGVGDGSGLSGVGPFVCSFLALRWFPHSRPLPEISRQDRLIRSLVSQLETTRLTLEPKARVLLLDEPFEPDYTPLFL